MKQKITVLLALLGLVSCNEANEMTSSGDYDLPDFQNNLEILQQVGYSGVTFQPRSSSIIQIGRKPTQDWDFESLRHMGPTAAYKDSTPDGYSEQITYTDGDSKVNTPQWKVDEHQEIYDEGKKLSAESSHSTPLYPNEDSLKPKESAAKPQGVFKQNFTGEVPSTVQAAGSFIIVGGGAVQLSNQERLYKYMYEQSREKQTEDFLSDNQKKLYQLMQSQTYPSADSKSFIDNTSQGFREHAWANQQFAEGNYTDEAHYLKHMPKGYELDLKKAYSVPVQQQANSSVSSNSTEASNSTANSTQEPAANGTASDSTSANETATSTENATASSSENATAASNSSGDSNSTASANGTTNSSASSSAGTQQKKWHLELNDTQTQQRYEQSIKDTYESFAQQPTNQKQVSSNSKDEKKADGSNQQPIYPAKDSHSTIEPYNQRDHAWNEEQYTNSSEKSWQESTPNGMPLKGTYSQKSQAPIYPAKDSQSTIEPYNQRDHAWNEEQFTNSSEKSWKASSPNGMPLKDTYAQKQRAPIYPAKDSQSTIEPYNQRDHAWNDEQFTNSSEKSWKASSPNGMALKDTYAQQGRAPIYPAKDSQSTIEPYNQRDHSWNEEQFTNSSEKSWKESSPNGMPLKDTYAQRFRAPIYPAKDSQSTIEPYNQRDHAWNDEQFTNSSEKSWKESSPNGMPLKDTYAQQYRAPIYPAKDSQSTIEPYNQRDHAWNDEQFTNSSEKSWKESSPNGMPLKDTYAQRNSAPIYPAKDSQSTIEPYNQRDHAWNEEQFTNSSEKSWKASSPNGMPLKDTYAQQQSGHLAFMSIREALDFYRVETDSKIIPYVIRDHAWSFDHHDKTNFYRYRDDAPEGYRDAVKYIQPHPTNQPVPPKVVLDVKEKEVPDDKLDIEEEKKRKAKQDKLDKEQLEKEQKEEAAEIAAEKAANPAKAQLNATNAIAANATLKAAANQTANVSTTANQTVDAKANVSSNASVAVQANVTNGEKVNAPVSSNTQKGTQEVQKQADSKVEKKEEAAQQNDKKAGVEIKKPEPNVQSAAESKQTVKASK